MKTRPHVNDDEVNETNALPLLPLSKSRDSFAY